MGSGESGPLMPIPDSSNVVIGMFYEVLMQERSPLAFPVGAKKRAVRSAWSKILSSIRRVVLAGADVFYLGGRRIGCFGGARGIDLPRRSVWTRSLIVSWKGETQRRSESVTADSLASSF